MKETNVFYKLAIRHKRAASLYKRKFKELLDRRIQMYGKYWRLMDFNSAGVPFFREDDFYGDKISDQLYTLSGCDKKWCEDAIADIIKRGDTKKEARAREK